EKHALIATLAEQLNAPPVALPPPAQWSSLDPEHDEFRRVTFSASFGAGPDAKVYTSGSALRADVTTPGSFVFAPAALADGRIVVVDRGFIPDGATAGEAPGEPSQLTGYLRFPEKPGWVTPAPDIGKRLWFARDHLSMTRALGWGEAAPFYIDLEA